MFRLKRFFDLFLSLVFIMVSLPFILLIGFAIKIDSKGPIFFIQKRLGKNCSTFKMYKFRTMIQGAENIGTGLFSYENDPRITKVGHILRLTSLDELPQIFNVLIGNMSIVGPRPPVTYELGPVEDFNDNLKARFRVKPGITGLAQISGRNDLTWPEKIKFDNEYIRLLFEKGLILDLKIIFKTLFVVLTMSNIVEKEK